MLDLKTAGESHGMGIIALIQGLPAGFLVDKERIENELMRRRAGKGRSDRMKIERDEVEILAGVYKGKSTGAPIAILIKNTEHEKWKEFFEEKKTDEQLERYVCRPGHADYAGAVKFNHYSVRPVLERASARHTVAYVAAGAVFKAVLEQFGIFCGSFLTSMGRIKFTVPEKITFRDIENVWNNEMPVFRVDEVAKAEAEINQAKNLGTTLGGSACFCAFGVPPGLGSYADYSSRLDYSLGGLMMSIPSVKAVVIGRGLEAAEKNGFEVLDEFELSEDYVKRTTNFAGGIEGGVSNGEVIYGQVYFKPIPTQENPLKGYNLKENSIEKAFYERSDTFVGEAICVIAESMLAYAILKELLKKFGGDSKEDIRASYESYLKRIKWRRAEVLHW